MKKLFFLLMLLPSLLLAATGDLTVKIRPDGWTAEVTAEGFTSGATYAFGYGTGNAPSSTTPYFTVVSQSYDVPSLSAGTIPRTVHMTSTLRLPYASKSQPGGTWSGTFVDGETITCSTSGATAVKVGDQAAGAAIVFKSLTLTPLSGQTWTGGTSGATFVNTSSTITTYTVPTTDERASGTALTAVVALSEYIYVDDNTGAGKSGTAPTVTIPAGFITNTGGASQTSNLLTAGAVTNNSTATYQPVLGNWSYQFHGTRMDSSSKLRVVAFDRHAQQRNPVRAVKFTVTDGTTTINNVITQATRDTALGDAVPVVEYISDTDLTAGMTQGASLTLNFTIYPWVGDTPLVSSDGGFSYPDPRHCTLTSVCDKTGAYSTSYAVVDGTGGSDPGAFTLASDSGKWVGSGAGPGTGSGLTAYATIARAARAIYNYNLNAYARGDVSGGTIWVKAGNYSSFGATVTGGYGTTPAVFLTIKPFTGLGVTDVNITGTSGDKDISDRVKYQGLTLSTATDNTFTGCLAMWFDQCKIDSATATSVWGSAGQCVWFTHCDIPQLRQGIVNLSSSTNITFPLVRGCTFTGFSREIFPFTFIGNSMVSNPGTTKLLISSQGSGPPLPQSQIIAFNRFYDYKTSSAVMLALGDTQYMPVRGTAVVQNLFEVSGTTTGELASIGSSDGVSTNTPYDNVLIWNNTFSGQRQNFGYNSSGSTTKYRRYWSIKNNVFYDPNTKHDAFATENGLRIGGWSVDHMVGGSGNLMSGRGLGFQPRFYGLYSTQKLTWVSEGSPYFQFVNYAGSVNAVAGAGGGDYRIYTGSPAYRQQRDCLIPFDISGKPRSGNEDSAGAYSEGGVRPASMMFAN